MKKWLLLIFLGASFSSMSQDLVLEWDFFHPKKKTWMDLGTNGSVQEALINSGEMPDPFYGKNELQFGWFEEYDWQFKSIFFISKEQIEKEFVELEFGNVDTYAKIYLNDSLILETANAFIPHSVQVKSLLKEGLNELNVVIVPPVRFHKNTYDEMGYRLPAPNDVHDVAIAPLVRKPQYQFGWDWALRLNTIGFNKPASIKAYNTNRLINHTVRTIELSEDSAVLEIEAHFSVKSNERITWGSELFGSKEVQLKNGIAIRKVIVQNPNLWWPKGHGDQYLYHDNWSFSGNSNLVDEKELNFGIKTSELIQEKDQWGTSYYFKINGRTIFCKGGDYIPQDIFPARVKDEDIISLVQDMADANFNMVRVWGGGYYPDEIFFETCDKLGIMVWEDFMFACAMYPGDERFLQNVREEFEYQVPRITAHPSVVLFNGNNEVEVAWGNWGFQVKYGLYGKSAKEIETAYDDLFKKLAPSVVEEFTTIPYIHTSPLSNWGKAEFYNHGSQHYWGVWHGKDPIEDFGKKIGRFNAEYGFQSFPEYSTIETFSDSSDWDLSSDVMKHHQKSYVGNDMILKHAKKLYGNPKDFSEFVYFSQLTQSMAVSMAVAGHRVDFPRCGGTLYWQVNDCWPAPSWSSIDYYGNWKALHYQMKKDFEDLAVVAKYNDLTSIDYYLVNELPDTFMSQIKCEVFDLEGKEIATVQLSQMVNGQGSQKMCIEGLKDDLASNNRVLRFTYTDKSGREHIRMFDNLPLEYEKATTLDVNVTVISDGPKKARVLIENSKFVRNFWLYSSNAKMKFSSNFESFLPGKHYIEITSEEDLDLEDLNSIWL